MSRDKTATTYHCECIKCGYEMDSEKHCADIKCPKCGGQMRRKERPGPGQGSAADKGFIQTARQRAREEGTTVAEALKKVRKENPQLYKNFRKNL